MDSENECFNKLEDLKKKYSHLYQKLEKKGKHKQIEALYKCLAKKPVKEHLQKLEEILEKLLVATRKSCSEKKPNDPSTKEEDRSKGGLVDIEGNLNNTKSGEIEAIDIRDNESQSDNLIFTPGISQLAKHDSITQTNLPIKNVNSSNNKVSETKCKRKNNCLQGSNTHQDLTVKSRIIEGISLISNISHIKTEDESDVELPHTSGRRTKDYIDSDVEIVAAVGGSRSKHLSRKETSFVSLKEVNEKSVYHQVREDKMMLNGRLANMKHGTVLDLVDEQDKVKPSRNHQSSFQASQKSKTTLSDIGKLISEETYGNLKVAVENLGVNKYPSNHPCSNSTKNKRETLTNLSCRERESEKYLHPPSNYFRKPLLPTPRQFSKPTGQPPRGSKSHLKLSSREHISPVERNKPLFSAEQSLPNMQDACRKVQFSCSVTLPPTTAMQPGWYQNNQQHFQSTHSNGPCQGSMQCPNNNSFKYLPTPFPTHGGSLGPNLQHSTPVAHSEIDLNYMQPSHNQLSSCLSCQTKQDFSRNFVSNVPNNSINNAHVQGFSRNQPSVNDDRKSMEYNSSCCQKIDLPNENSSFGPARHSHPESRLRGDDYEKLANRQSIFDKIFQTNREKSREKYIFPERMHRNGAFADNYENTPKMKSAFNDSSFCKRTMTEKRVSDQEEFRSGLLNIPNIDSRQTLSSRQLYIDRQAGRHSAYRYNSKDHVRNCRETNLEAEKDEVTSYKKEYVSPLANLYDRPGLNNSRIKGTHKPKIITSNSPKQKESQTKNTKVESTEKDKTIIKPASDEQMLKINTMDTKNESKVVSKDSALHENRVKNSECDKPQINTSNNQIPKEPQTKNTKVEPNKQKQKETQTKNTEVEPTKKNKPNINLPSGNEQKSKINTMVTKNKSTVVAKDSFTHEERVNSDPNVYYKVGQKNIVVVECKTENEENKITPQRSGKKKRAYTTESNSANKASNKKNIKQHNTVEIKTDCSKKVVKEIKRETKGSHTLCLSKSNKKAKPKYNFKSDNPQTNIDSDSDKNFSSDDSYSKFSDKFDKSKKAKSKTLKKRIRVLYSQSESSDEDTTSKVKTKSNCAIQKNKKLKISSKKEKLNNSKLLKYTSDSNNETEFANNALDQDTLLDHIKPNESKKRKDASSEVEKNTNKLVAKNTSSDKIYNQSKKSKKRSLSDIETIQPLDQKKRKCEKTSNGEVFKDKKDSLDDQSLLMKELCKPEIVQAIVKLASLLKISNQENINETIAVKQMVENMLSDKTEIKESKQCSNESCQSSAGDKATTSITSNVLSSLDQPIKHSEPEKQEDVGSQVSNHSLVIENVNKPCHSKSIKMKGKERKSVDVNTISEEELNKKRKKITRQKSKRISELDKIQEDLNSAPQYTDIMKTTAMRTCRLKYELKGIFTEDIIDVPSPKKRKRTQKKRKAAPKVSDFTSDVCSSGNVTPSLSSTNSSFIEIVEDVKKHCEETIEKPMQQPISVTSPVDNVEEISNSTSYLEIERVFSLPDENANTKLRKPGDVENIAQEMLAGFRDDLEERRKDAVVLERTKNNRPGRRMSCAVAGVTFKHEKCSEK